MKTEIASGPAEITQTETIPVTKENVRFLGRTFQKDDVIFFNWTCAGFELCFEGEALEAQFITSKTEIPYERAYLNVFLDGNEAPLYAKVIPLDQEKAFYTLAEGLDKGIHKIKVVKKTAVNTANAGVTMLRFPKGGRLLPAPFPKKWKLEFIGDSITTGFCMHEPDFNGEGPTSTEDGWQTYAANAARALDADFHVIAISGCGLVCNLFGIEIFNLPDEYKMVDNPNGLNEKWDYDSYHPNAVVINLGTNDSGNVGVDGKYSHEFWIQAYINFMTFIKRKHPNTKIIAAYGCMGNRADLLHDIKEACCRVNSQYHEEFAYPLYLHEDIEQDGVSGGGHPTVKAQIRHGKTLEEKIREITGWTK